MIANLDMYKAPVRQHFSIFLFLVILQSGVGLGFNLGGVDHLIGQAEAEGGEEYQQTGRPRHDQLKTRYVRQVMYGVWSERSRHDKLGK